MKQRASTAPMTNDSGREWLEVDGWGGFASGTPELVRTRRYHGLLLSAERPPADRWMLVNGVEAWVSAADGERQALTSHRYRNGVIHPNGYRHIEAFAHDPWPQWTFRLDEQTKIVFEIIVPREGPTTLLRWSRLGAASRWNRLEVRLLGSGRDPHHLRSAEGESPVVGLEVEGARISFDLSPGAPRVHVWGHQSYRHAPEWFRQFEYSEELARGLDGHEDLASPGVFSWPLDRGQASLVLSTDSEAISPHSSAKAFADASLAKVRERRARSADPLERAAAAYVVRRGKGHTVIAGYPWFGDWGRDTFIALRGLRHLSAGSTLERSILMNWSEVVSEGMLPNRFPDRGDVPEYNSVDASLWYVLAVRDHLQRGPAPADVEKRLREAVVAILRGYAQGTRHGIRADPEDGLLFAGEPGVQLTWMDAKVGDWVVTPRVGKPVEIQALWLAGLAFAGADAGLQQLEAKALAHFVDKFLDPDRGFLRDVVDVDHQPGTYDDRLRPNQVFALGGLGVELVPQEAARRAVDIVETRLWTPAGPRSLEPGDSDYRPLYQGGVWERDGAYHQGTVWPWLTGPFVDAWVSVRGGGAEVELEARTRFVTPLLKQLSHSGLGHVSEIADGEAPHHPRGAPFQAWSVTELLRLDRLLAR